jgi:hypothetical protein
MPVKPIANNLILLLALTGAGAAASPSEAGAADRAATPAAERPSTGVEAQEAELQRRIAARTERAKREAEFNQLDRDGDGYLNEAELAAKEDLQPGRDELDRDDDGRISRSEFAAVETTSVGPDERPGVDREPGEAPETRPRASEGQGSDAPR